MSATNIRELKDRYRGEKINVVASGASMDHVPREFFGNEIVIAVNEMFRHVRFTYVLMHHTDHADEAIAASRDRKWQDSRSGLVVSDVSYDMPPRWGKQNVFEGDYSQYRTAGYSMSLSPTIDVERLRNRQDDELVVSACTTAEAMQFAAHLGASAIVLCGADCGTLDGRINVAGYNGGAATNPQHAILVEPIIVAVANVLREQGIAVVSLNPFVNLNLEGHVFERPKQLRGNALIQTLNRMHAS